MRRAHMAIVAVPPAPDLLRRVARLQVLAIAWMTVEAIVALAAAWTARSPVLLGFGRIVFGDHCPLAISSQR